MRITNIINIDDCFDGSGIKELCFDCEITKDFIFSLTNHGTLKYFGDFARPFYKLTVNDKYYIKGVEGNNTMRIFLQNQKYLNDFIQSVIQ